MESHVPFQASSSMAVLTRDWDQSLGELQNGDEAIFSLSHVELLSQTATALTAIWAKQHLQLCSDILG